MMMSGTSQSADRARRIGRVGLTIDSSHDEADLHGIGGAGEMGIDLLGLVLVKGNEAVEDVVAGRVVVGTT
jgi:hypothetical protein